MKKSLPIVVAAALGLLLAGCSASASLTVNPDTLADQVATVLQEQVGSADKPSVDCGPDNIALKNDNVVMCVLTAGTDPDQYDVTVTFSNVDGTKYSFEAQVADTPQ